MLWLLVCLSVAGPRQEQEFCSKGLPYRSVSVIVSLVINSAALRALRERSGLTQVGLSERSGVSQAQISAIESGHEKARSTTIKKLADALLVPTVALMGPRDES